jgi:hypothetical protein
LSSETLAAIRSAIVAVTAVTSVVASMFSALGLVWFREQGVRADLGVP